MVNVMYILPQSEEKKKDTYLRLRKDFLHLHQKHYEKMALKKGNKTEHM